MKLIIASSQIDLLVGDIEGNCERIIEQARAGKAAGADLVVFSELCLTGYPPEDLLFRSALYQRVNAALQRLQAEVRDIAIIVGYPSQIEGNCYNCAAFLEDGKVHATYRKQLLPNYTVFDEKRYFARGKNPAIVNFKDTKIGLLICEDLWQPEPLRATVDAGAQLIISINASPFSATKASKREELLAKRARESNCPIVYVNQVGAQDELVFDGGSVIINAQGEVTQRGSFFQEELLITEFATNHPPIPQKYPVADLPSDEAYIYQALVLGVKDYVKKNNFPGALLGLSGGIDSGLMVAIAVDALGKENVEAVMMPTQYTADISLADAAEQAKLLSVKYHVINIENIFHAFLDNLKPIFAGKKVDTTEENIQARCRGTLLMAMSNKSGKIVLATGNKSEMAVGYATLYGDMAGGFAALKDVPKTLIYRLAHYRNQMSNVIPQRIIDRPPSAELAPDQKDEDSLPPYNILDEILDRYIAKEQSYEEICAAGFTPAIVKKVIQLVTRNEYKRRQAPTGIRISQHAFGKDRRYPISSGYHKSLND